MAVFHDITDRRAAEARIAAANEVVRAELASRTAAEASLRVARDELAAQKAYLDQVIDAIDVAVITCDTAGTIVHANRVARQAIPGNDGPLDDRRDGAQVDMRSPDDGTAFRVNDTPLMRALRGEKIDGTEATISIPDGSRRVIMCTPARCTTPPGRPSAPSPARTTSPRCANARPSCAPSPRWPRTTSRLRGRRRRLRRDPRRRPRRRPGRAGTAASDAGPGTCRRGSDAPAHRRPAHVRHHRDRQ